MSNKVKLDVACELLRQAIKKSVSCPSVDLRWEKMATVSTQKKKLLSIQNSKVRF